jgi:hypothetical protein
MFWFVRTGSDPMLLAAAFAQEVRRVNGDVVASQVNFLQVAATVTIAALLAAGIPSLRAVRAQHVNMHSE